MTSQLEIRDAVFPAETELVRSLLVDYQTELGVDLCFQGFDEELRTLPGRYAPPSGALLLAGADGQVAGCVGLRGLEPSVCEMKRLYLRPALRGGGRGRALAGEIIGRGRALGYRRMLLDTLPQMGPAIGLYRSLGFRETPPYTENPVPGAVVLELEL